MSSYRAAADLLRLAVASGYRPVADAVAWADAIVAADPAPPVEIIEVALGGQLDRSAMAELLDAVPGETNLVEVARQVLGQLRAELGRDRFAPAAIAKLLYDMASLGYLPEEHFGPEPRFLDDSFELAARGAYGTYEDATARLERYLTAHGARPTA